MSNCSDNINSNTTIDDLADIVRDLDASMTVRIYDDFQQVIGAIRLVHVDEIQQIDQLRKLKDDHKHALH